MANSPWRAALQTGKTRLISLPNGAGVRCMVIETTGIRSPPNPDPTLLDPACRFEDRVHFGVGMHRLFAQLFSADGKTLYTDKPVLDLGGEPIQTRNAKYPAIQLPTSRLVCIYGNKSAAHAIEPIAESLGRSLAVPEQPHPVVDPNSIRTTDDLRRWVFVVFDIAWASARGSLPGAGFAAKKMIRIPYLGSDGEQIPDCATIPCSMPLAELHALRNASPPAMAQALKQVPDDPQWFYSIIDDFVSASIAAIDVLLSDPVETAKQTDTTQSDHIAPKTRA